MKVRMTGRGGMVAALVVFVMVLASACVGPGAVHVDADGLPGTYRDDKTGGEVQLHADGRFSATGISKSDAVMGSVDTASVDFAGAWSATPSEFVYLEPDDTGGGRDMEDIQLWTASANEVFLHPDVDGPVTLKLARVTTD